MTFKATLPLLNALQHDQFIAGSFISSFVILCHKLDDGIDYESRNSTNVWCVLMLLYVIR